MRTFADMQNIKINRKGSVSNESKETKEKLEVAVVSKKCQGTIAMNKFGHFVSQLRADYGETHLNQKTSLYTG